MKPERANRQDAATSAPSGEVGSALEPAADRKVSAEITLDLVVKTAFELQKLRGPKDFQEAATEGRIDLYFYDLGTEAIRLLFGWEQLLRTEKEAGWALRKSSWMARLRQEKIRQEQQEDERFRAYLTQRVQMLESLAQKRDTTPVPFNKAAKDLLPGARTKRQDAVSDLMVYLDTLAQMFSKEHHPLGPIIQQCLKEQTIPKGFISDLKPLFERLYEFLVSEKRKAIGAKGGRHRVASRLTLERSSQRAKRERAA
jgi:hypothetical protein